MTAGLEPLVVGRWQMPGAPCGFEHVLNLLWSPILEYMDALTDNAAPEWSERLALNHAALVAEMRGIVVNANKPMVMDTWIEFIQQTLCRLLEVHVPKRLILKVLSRRFPLHVEPTRANALHLLRSKWCSKLTGSALGAHAN